MKAPYNWIRDYVKTDVSPEKLAEMMIMTGNGVEDVIKMGANMQNVVVGKILSIEKHPDADKLVVCQIDVGSEAPLQIVTGATNVFEGAYVPVAMHNSHLPNGVNIKKGKLRGVVSEGMLCSGEELVLKEADYPGAEVNGILILQGEPAPGTDMRDVLMQNDTILDFEVGANRPDCLSILGVARETAAALDTDITIPEPKFSENNIQLSDLVSVEVKDADLCPRYMARGVVNVKIGPSPKWMQERLIAAGMRPISNIVDITNFVMLETGQPMHAFDHAHIRGGKITVRRASEGEKLVTLDGKERIFNSNALLITDEEGAIGIAGIMGGENSEITADTKTVIFESAKFGYGNIRQTSRALGIATESSMRFSKGVEACTSEYALHRACQLVEELGAGEIVSGEIDILAEDLSEKVVYARPEEVNSLLGTDISAEEMVKVLNRVFIKTVYEDGTLKCIIPGFRGDIYGKADIAEEVARIYGYDNIAENPASGKSVESVMKFSMAPADRLKHVLSTGGYYECMNFVFMGMATLDKLGLPEDHALRNAVRILNPFGDDSAYMHTTLVPGLLDNIAVNLKRKSKSVRLFELGREFIPTDESLPNERKVVALAAAGDGIDFFSFKGDIESMFDAMGTANAPSFAPGGDVYMHPGRSAVISLAGKEIGFMGEIHPDVLKNWGISRRTYVAVIGMADIEADLRFDITYKPLPNYPAIERDIAVTVDTKALAGALLDCIKSNGGKYLEAASLFDVYEGEQMGEGKKSLAYSLTFRSADSTLKDEDIAGDIDNILAALKENFGAELR